MGGADSTGVPGAVHLVEALGQTWPDVLADEQWTHVGLHLTNTAEFLTDGPNTFGGFAFFAYPADQCFPGTYTSSEEAFADDVPPAAPSFVDTETDDTLCAEMLWMAGAGTSGGWDVGDGKAYRPHEEVDRDVMAAFLHRLAQQLEG